MHLSVGEAMPSLCHSCKNKREVRTARSRFLLCELSFTNEDFRKYPSQPVLACAGYESNDETITTRPDGRPERNA